MLPHAFSGTSHRVIVQLIRSSEHPRLLLYIRVHYMHIANDVLYMYSMRCMVIHYQDIRELDIFRPEKLYIVMGYSY